MKLQRRSGNIGMVRSTRYTEDDVTKMNGSKVTVNTDLIETVEEMPDTVITLTTGKKFIIKESRQEVKNLVILYKRECNSIDFK